MAAGRKWACPKIAPARRRVAVFRNVPGLVIDGGGRNPLRTNMLCTLATNCCFRRRCLQSVAVYPAHGRKLEWGEGGTDIGRGGWNEEEERRREEACCSAWRVNANKRLPFLPSFLPPPPYIIACSKVPLLSFPLKKLRGSYTLGIENTARVSANLASLLPSSEMD